MVPHFDTVKNCAVRPERLQFKDVLTVRIVTRAHFVAGEFLRCHPKPERLASAAYALATSC
jgi:hypothetical protein